MLFVGFLVVLLVNRVITFHWTLSVYCYL
jgi:hypothetical protein